MEGDRNMESYFMDYHCSCCKHIVMVNGMETEGRKIGNANSYFLYKINDRG